MTCTTRDRRTRLPIGPCYAQTMDVAGIAASPWISTPWPAAAPKLSMVPPWPSEAASIEPEVNDILAARNNGQIAELADALRAGAPSLSAPDAEVYASILLAPLSYYFQVFLRGRPFNERRVRDALASSWMAIMADISEPPEDNSPAD